VGLEADPRELPHAGEAAPLARVSNARRRSFRPPDAGPHGPACPTPPRDFALALERRRTGTAVLVLVGELDLYRAGEIEDALAEAIESDRDHDRPGWVGRAVSADGETKESHRVVVDLRSVTFLDLTTLGILLAASGRQRARGSELLVLVGPQTPTTAFEVTGFDRLLAIRRVGARAPGPDH
jgi:anti-anti-sigma regulatory factor